MVVTRHLVGTELYAKISEVLFGVASDAPGIQEDIPFTFDRQWFLGIAAENGVK